MIKFAYRLFTSANIFDIIQTNIKEAYGIMWWNSMTLLQQVMFIIACASTALLAIQIILMLIGSIGSDVEISGGGLSDAADGLELGGGMSDAGVSDVIGGGIGDTDVSDVIGGDKFTLDGLGGGSATDVGGSDVGDMPKSGGSSMPFGLRLLSFRSLVAFTVIGSWVLYTASYGMAWYYAVILAVVCGFAAACGMAGAIVGMEKLQDNGNIDPTNAVGKTGTVYLTVPPKRSGQGKINVLVQERYAEYFAVTDSGEPIPTASEIKVVGHVGNNVLLVERYKKPSIIVETQK